MNSLCISALLQNTATVTTTTIADFRAYILSKIPNARITWCPDNAFVFTGNKNNENSLIASYLALGDDLAYWDGFPSIDHPTLAQYQASVDEFWTNCNIRYGVTPTAATSWHLPASYLNYLISKWVQIATATVWSQTWVDRFQGEWSRLFPYYPSNTNSFVPAKTQTETLDIISCNSLSPDPLGCRYIDGDNRWTLHPADPNPLNSDSQKHIIDQSLLQSELPLFVYPEISWLYQNAEILANRFKELIDYISTRNISVISLNDYNTYFRVKYTNNYNKWWMIYTGSWLTKWSATSSANFKQYWYEDQDCSVCIQENLTTHAKTVEACLQYDKNQPESLWYFSFNGTLYKDWSYRLWKSYKFDQYSTYYDKNRKRFVDRAMDFHKI